MPLHLASLGSSFAAGPRIPPASTYAPLLSRRLHAQLTTLSASGATLTNLLSEPQTTLLTRRTFPPQIQGLSADVDVVLITAGGNDLGYVGAVVRDSLAGSWVGRVLRWLFSRGSAEGKKLEAEELAERFVQVIDAILLRCPRVRRILLVEYLTLFGADVRAGVDVPLSEAQIEGHRGVALTLRRAYALAAEARSGVCSVVGVAERSWGHGVGSEVPWVEGWGWGVLFRGRAPYHPNAEGMKAVAEIIYEELELELGGGLAAERGDGDGDGE